VGPVWHPSLHPRPPAWRPQACDWERGELRNNFCPRYPTLKLKQLGDMEDLEAWLVRAYGGDAAGAAAGVSAAARAGALAPQQQTLHPHPHPQLALALRPQLARATVEFLFAAAAAVGAVVLRGRSLKRPALAAATLAAVVLSFAVAHTFGTRRTQRLFAAAFSQAKHSVPPPPPRPGGGGRGRPPPPPPPALASHSPVQALSPYASCEGADVVAVLSLRVFVASAEVGLNDGIHGAVRS
jgi:hypothetical protein